LKQALEFERAGNYPGAEALYRQIVQAAPDHWEAWRRLGAMCQARGNLGEAAASFLQALRLKPDDAEVNNDLGIILATRGQLEEAAARFQETLRLQPDFADACNNLGIVLGMQGKHAEAVARLQEAVRLRPGYAEAYSNLADALNSLRRHDEAADQCRQALRLNPAMAGAHNNLGMALKGLDQIDEAIASYQEAIRLSPGLADAHYNLGNALKALNRLDEALACYERAVQLNPRHANAHFHRSLVWLVRGNFEQGWPAYEWRWQCPGGPLRRFAQPLWDGSPLGGRTILLHAEQGLGDTLQFIRYVPYVRERGGRVLVECQAPLLGVVSRVGGIDGVAAQGAALPAFDVQASFLSLPGIFRANLATMPAAVPYLTADPDAVEKWRQELNAVSGVKVGIVWQGSRRHREDRSRSVQVFQFAPLAQVAGVRLVSLQTGRGSEQVKGASYQFPLVDLGSRFDPASLGDVAAVVYNLDLVVTVDTAVAHLAGGMGVRVWVALPFAPDFRWLLGREDSPWYPTMRLFRQSERGNWNQVFRRIAEELLKVLTNA
jgi:tetratricopeptide (TPR) repeat protein